MRPAIARPAASSREELIRLPEAKRSIAFSISSFEDAKWRCAFKDEILVPIVMLMINTPKVNKPTLFL